MRCKLEGRAGKVICKQKKVKTESCVHLTLSSVLYTPGVCTHVHTTYTQRFAIASCTSLIGYLVLIISA